MSRITKLPERAIIEDFAKEIRQKRQETAKPSKTIIHFRTDVSDGNERIVWSVPTDILRFRKENGRIASDVLDYENNVGPLDENDDEAQIILRKFLQDKDPEKTATLKQSIIHQKQREPAIITCDGFLINGNRRKMAMDWLREQHPGNSDFCYMKVVILPGKDEEGGPPTLKEIEQLENRYQLHAEGKSEYYGFDRALSIKRKIEMGLSLREQLLDDSKHVNKTDKELKKAEREIMKEYLLPLKCVDRYLKQFNRQGQYRTVSTGISDPEGRWQALKDYSATYERVFNSPPMRTKHNIEDDEIGELEEAAFNLIRLRSSEEHLPKTHMIMRHLPKYCEKPEGKKEILKIAAEVEPLLPNKECINDKGDPLTHKQIDDKWAAKYKRPIIHHARKAIDIHATQKEKDTPIDLLEAAYKKLTHDNMQLKNIAVGDYKKAMSIAADIKKKSDIIESEIYHHMKEFKSLGKNKK